MVVPQRSLVRMTVCQTCGDKGYSKLLIHCLQCQIGALHRYCMDGPSTIDDEEVFWYCEDCVPRVAKPTVPCRKSERMSTKVDRQALRRRAQRKWRNNVSLLEAEKTDDVRESALKATSDTSKWNHKCKDGIHDDQQGYCDKNMTCQLTQFPDNLETNASAISERKNESSLLQHSLHDNENKTTMVQGGKSPGPRKRSTDAEMENRQTDPLIRQREDLFSRKIVRKSRTKAVVLTREKESDRSSGPHKRSTDTEMESCQTVPLIRQVKDLLSVKIVRKSRTKAAVLTGEKEGDRSSNGDVEDQQVKLEKNVASVHGDSILEKEDKHEKSLDEVDSKLTGEFNGISTSRDTKQSDYGNQEPEVIEEAIGNFLDHRGEDMQSSCTIRESSSPRKKRRLVIEMEYSNDNATYAPAEPSSPKSSSDDIFSTSSRKSPVKLGDDHAPPAKPADHIPTLTSLVTIAKHVLHHPSPLKLVDHVPSQPIIDIIWRGGCGISNNIDPICFELEAHVSNKASPVVYGAASALPKIIDFEIVPRRYAWPKSFEKSPPTGEIIGLYFFPLGERNEILYQNLLDKMIDRQLMLISQINNLELLVFCSRELPEEEWRFRRKYYLWGVFRQKQETMVPIKPHATQINNSLLSSPANSPRDGVYQKQRDSNHKTLNHFREAEHPDNLNRPKPVFSSETHNTQLDRDQHHGSCRWRNHHQNSRKFGKCQAEFDGYAYDNRKASYHVKVQHHRNRGHDAIWIKPVQNESYHGKCIIATTEDMRTMIDGKFGP